MLGNNEMFLQAIEEFGIIMLNVDGVIKWCNKATHTITGYLCNELFGKPFSFLYTEEDIKRKRGEDELYDVLKTGYFYSESWKAKKDGSKYWSTMSISPVYSEGQQHAGYSVALKDITEKKQEELEVRM